jgi:hypothetical protein
MHRKARIDARPALPEAQPMSDVAARDGGQAPGALHHIIIRYNRVMKICSFFLLFGKIA